MSDARATIVVPCYNEAERLPIQAFTSFVAEDEVCDFLFVDDGSTDETADVLAALCAREPDRFRWLSLAVNGGKAEAVRQGMSAAMRGGATYAGYWDADLATPLDVIAIMRGALEADDALIGALGSRVRLLGRSIDRRPMRHYLGRVMATAASLVLKMPVYDTQCGAKLFRTSAVTSDLFAAPFMSRWLFDIEILARFRQAHLAGATPPPRDAFVEIPLERWTDVGGSKMRVVQMIGAGVDLVRIAVRYRA